MLEIRNNNSTLYGVGLRRRLMSLLRSRSCCLALSFTCGMVSKFCVSNWPSFQYNTSNGSTLLGVKNARFVSFKINYKCEMKFVPTKISCVCVCSYHKWMSAKKLFAHFRLRLAASGQQVNEWTVVFIK